jgi:hypothetical protein
MVDTDTDTVTTVASDPLMPKPTQHSSTLPITHMPMEPMPHTATVFAHLHQHLHQEAASNMSVPQLPLMASTNCTNVMLKPMLSQKHITVMAVMEDTHTQDTVMAVMPDMDADTDTLDTVDTDTVDTDTAPDMADTMVNLFLNKILVSYLSNLIKSGTTFHKAVVCKEF